MQEKRIERILREIGVPVKFHGFWYIIDALQEMDNWNLRYLKVTELYRIVGKRYGVKWTAVERDIRHSLRTARKNGNKEAINRYIGTLYPQNKESLLNLYMAIKREESEKVDAA